MQTHGRLVILVKSIYRGRPLRLNPQGVGGRRTLRVWEVQGFVGACLHHWC